MLAQSGMEMSMENRCGSYLQMNQDVVHAECREEGIEVLSYKKAMEKYEPGPGTTTGRPLTRIKMKLQNIGNSILAKRKRSS